MLVFFYFFFILHLSLTRVVRYIICFNLDLEFISLQFFVILCVIAFLVFSLSEEEDKQCFHLVFESISWWGGPGVCALGGSALKEAFLLKQKPSQTFKIMKHISLTTWQNHATAHVTPWWHIQIFVWPWIHTYIQI